MANVEAWIRYRCPFCLYDGERYKFERKNKDRRKIKALLTCPDCGKRFYRKSNVNEMTPAGYIEFIVTYPIGAFWAKADFAKMTARLDTLLDTQKFWAEYRESKKAHGIPDFHPTE